MGRRFSLAFLVVVLVVTAGLARAEPRPLEPAPSPVDNPLKGLVPYARPTPGRFPHSMEFGYLPLSGMMRGPDEFDWRPLETLLDDIASRGNQTVFRVYLEYPGKKEGIPEFLIREGLKVHVYKNTNTAPLPPAESRTPDYSNPQLRKALRSFIAALGAKYDGDPRVAYITAGLLGTWGEWHTYPRDDLWAEKSVQAEVLDAYAAAFRQTPILLRYPAGPDTWAQASNADRPFGYHDDSFAWATLKTKRKQDDWFFVPSLESAGPNAVDKWKTQPIGGEIRPEVWGRIFDEEPKHKQAQDFAECVRQTHATWLMDSGMFREQAKPERLARAVERVRRMGYDFRVTTADIRPGANVVDVALQVVNEGVAPFYRDWPVEVGVLSSEGRVLVSHRPDWKLTGLLPGDAARKWEFSLSTKDLPAGTHSLAIRVSNPLPNGRPLRFANKDQDRHAAGWLTVGEVESR
jgi:hypothetical protein